MMTDRNRIIYLLEKYAAKEATAAEETELFEIMNQVEHQADLQDEVARIFEELEPVYLTGVAREKILREIGLPLGPSLNEKQVEKKLVPAAAGGAPVRRIFPWRRAVVAASVMLLVGLGTYFLVFDRKGKQAEIAKTTLQNDIKAPETNRAMITLANGEKLYLDSAGNGELVRQSNVKLVKLANGEIAYQAISGEVTKEMQYNTLVNPRDSRVINITLADDTKVWLNAGSSLVYPVAFVGDERKVIITGEAYFEVTKNESMPFVVSKGDMEVKVLGTHFNVNAYEDEADIKITLLEGSVKVSKGLSSGLLKPGQQAQVASGIKVVSNADLDDVMAWKNGIFYFEKADLQMIMRQLSRWYDVEIIYEGEIPQREFAGEIQRDLNLSQVLRILEKNDVHFKTEGRKLIIRK